MKANTVSQIAKTAERSYSFTSNIVNGNKPCPILIGIKLSDAYPAIPLKTWLIGGKTGELKKKIEEVNDIFFQPISNSNPSN